jgi:hypothetical protein
MRRGHLGGLESRESGAAAAPLARTGDWFGGTTFHDSLAGD